MGPEIFKYLVMGVYIALTFYLSYIGMKKTKGLAGFSIGNKDMNPYLIGITMAASISSTATFVINPGFVFKDGISAFVHYGVAAWLGVVCALTLIAKGFRKVGEEKGSLTIPDWIFHRYGSRALSLFFALINLLSLTFIVLILFGCAIILSGMFSLSLHQSLVFTLLFVFSYVLMGGTYAHAFTNTLQGLMMILVSIVVFGHGLYAMDGSFMDNLRLVSPNFASLINSESTLYNSFFSVFVSGFLITSALMFQPHILTKILYVKEDKDVNRFLITTFISVGLFNLMLFVGLYAKFAGVEAAQDKIVVTYLGQLFSQGILAPYILVFISVTLLAAGMSTLDGILVAISSMVVNDIYFPFLGKKLSHEEREKRGLALSRYFLIAVGIVALLLAWNPPALVGIFAQAGVYGIAAASFVPIIVGVLFPGYIPVWVVSFSAMLGVFGHLYLFKIVGMTNPSVSSCIAMLFSLAFMLIYLVAIYFKKPAIVVE